MHRSDIETGSRIPLSKLEEIKACIEILEKIQKPIAIYSRDTQAFYAISTLGYMLIFAFFFGEVGIAYLMLYFSADTLTRFLPILSDKLNNLLPLYQQKKEDLKAHTAELIHLKLQLNENRHQIDSQISSLHHQVHGLLTRWWGNKSEDSQNNCHSWMNDEGEKTGLYQLYGFHPFDTNPTLFNDDFCEWDDRINGTHPMKDCNELISKMCNLQNQANELKIQQFSSIMNKQREIDQAQFTLDLLQNKIENIQAEMNNPEPDISTQFFFFFSIALLISVSIVLCIKWNNDRRKNKEVHDHLPTRVSEAIQDPILLERITKLATRLKIADSSNLSMTSLIAQLKQKSIEAEKKQKLAFTFFSGDLDAEATNHRFLAASRDGHVTRKIFAKAFKSMDEAPFPSGNKRCILF